MSENHETRCCPECLYDWDECECYNVDIEDRDWDADDDDQPSEYDEWQDCYGGDDWDYGQYDTPEDW